MMKLLPILYITDNNEIRANIYGNFDSWRSSILPSIINRCVMPNNDVFANNGITVYQ